MEGGSGEETGDAREASRASLVACSDLRKREEEMRRRGEGEEREARVGRK